MIFCKTFFVVFLNSHRWETPENAIKPKKSRKNWHRNFCRFFGEKFSTWTFCKNILMVFLNSPCRETPKNVLKKVKEYKNSDRGWVGPGFSKCTGGPSIFLPAPEPGSGSGARLDLGDHLPRFGGIGAPSSLMHHPAAPTREPHTHTPRTRTKWQMAVVSQGAPKKKNKSGRYHGTFFEIFWDFQVWF